MGRLVLLQGKSSGGPRTCSLLQWVGPAVSHTGPCPGRGTGRHRKEASREPEQPRHSLQAGAGGRSRPSFRHRGFGAGKRRNSGTGGAGNRRTAGRNGRGTRSRRHHPALHRPGRGVRFPGRTGDRERAGRHRGDTDRGDRDPGRQQLRRSAAPSPGGERNAALQHALQRHEPRLLSRPGHLAAGPGGRAFRVSGLFRLHQLGLSLGGTGRPAADRSRQWARFRHLGGKRHERRREFDHQGAAGRSGHNAEPPVRFLRSQRHRQPDGRGQPAHGVPDPRAGAERPLRLPGDPSASPIWIHSRGPSARSQTVPAPSIPRWKA